MFSKAPYSAAKAGVLGLTRSLAREVAHHRITVNAESPGVVDTDIRVGATDAQNGARLAAAVPMGRQGTPDEVAALFVWLSSKDAAYITGCTHNINGGSTSHETRCGTRRRDYRFRVHGRTSSASRPITFRPLGEALPLNVTSA